MLFQAPALRRQPRRVLGSLLWVTASLAFLFCGASRAAEVKDAQKLFLKGHYDDCIRLAQAAIRDDPRDEDWTILLCQSLLTIGQYPEAANVISNALERTPWSIRFLLTGREAYQQNGRTDKAAALLSEISDRVSARSFNFRDSANVIALGRAALLLGADPRKVLDNFYNRVKQSDPNYRETYLAIGQLALDKYDADLAAKTFQEGLDHFADDPDMLYGLAKSFANGDRKEMLPLLEKALEQNEKHVPTLLLLIDHLIDAEDYDKADELIGKVLAVNPHQADAWAYKAVLAHLRNHSDEETKDREAGLGLWKTNPRVDFLIGEKISQKYRFAEGSGYQRRALKSEEDYLPSKGQLAQDLLRLGQEDEGWALAEDVYKQDGYDVAAYNLVTLHDTISKFQVLTNAHFKLRMSPHEADIYGPRVLDLLERARQTLCKKYGISLAQPTTVEVFPEQKDFAVRTFGMPGGDGYLGVCFGNVITANSPAANVAARVNWEAMLWHEFCHVVTLNLTENKMPRWLSEGISVYEERQSNPSWGQGMTPRYREMVLKGELTPVGKLSGAFMAPKTPMHLQFAYYESSLVIEFLVDHYGLDAVRQILRDLAQDKTINQAIEAHTAPIKQIEKEFAAFAHDRAASLAKGLEWAEPDDDVLASGGEDAWVQKHPRTIWAITERAKKLIAEKKYAEAEEPLRKMLELYPENTGSDSAYALLAQAYRAQNDTNQERAVLVKLAQLDDEALEAYTRLMELDSTAGNWKGVKLNADRYLAVNPLVPQPYRYLAKAGEALGQPDQSISAYRTMLRLDPPDPADLHYRLARLLHQKGDPAAKRQVLEALEDAPRFRDAQRLLLQIAGNDHPTLAPAEPAVVTNATEVASPPPRPEANDRPNSSKPAPDP